MQETLLGIGIALIAAAVILLVISALYWTLNRRTFDASQAFYDRTYSKFILFLRCGIASALVAVLVFALRAVFR